MSTKAFAAPSATSPLAATTIKRREPLPTDVEIDILFCGVCHSDLHMARNEWGGAVYPVVPGHEILGRVTRVGAKVSKFKVGDLAAVGCMVDSCRTCDHCSKGLEQFCKSGAIFTYNAPDKHLGGMTYGGYSERVVCDEAFTLRVPTNLDPAAAAPLLCAGITTFSPLKRHGAGPGKKVGIVGLGGLGHMGVKFARAMGAHTVLFTTSEGKAADGTRLGAHEVVLSKNRGHGVGRPSARSVHGAAQARRHHGACGRAAHAAADQLLQPVHAAPQPDRIAHRRHCRDPADARLLRAARHHLRHRADPHPADQ
jgi:uncharacterized zinc-type alcohol dehydrogenase-like protein